MDFNRYEPTLFEQFMFIFALIGILSFCYWIYCVIKFLLF